VVQPSDFRNGDDLAIWHDGPSIGGVLTQGQVRSGAMIVGKVALQQTTKVPPIQNYHMIQTFTTNRTDQPFRECILPGTPGRGDNFFHGQRVDAATKRIAIDRVTIPNQVPPRITFPKRLGHFRTRLGHLLSRPLCRRMFSDAKVKNSSALMLDDEEDKQYPQANRRHGEEVDGNDLPYVVLSSRSATEVA
jgi:hypothetical protein